MQVKNALADKAQKLVDFLNTQITDLQRINAGLDKASWSLANNQRVIANYRDEIVELEDLRDGYLTVDKLGTARRFFNRLPDWATYGT
jgi:hypothetical protein